MTNRIIIVTPGYRESSGGRVVLHRLAHELAALGVPVALCPWKAENGFRLHDDYLRCPIEHSATRKDIVIYPDIVQGNPLRAANVVRWNLYYPRHAASKTDLVYHYAPTFGAPPYLTVFEPNLGVFAPTPVEIREGICWTWRKAEKQGWYRNERPGPEFGTEILKDASLASLAHAFRSHREFVCYDNATYMAIAARLCGCPVTMRSKRTLSPWLLHQLSMSTHELRAHHTRQLADQQARVRSFVNEAWVYFFGRQYRG